MQNHFQDFLIIDIETVSANPSMEKLTSSLQKHWKRKAGMIPNPEDKDAAGLYQDRAAIYAEFGKIIVIGVGFFHEFKGTPTLRVNSLADDDEKKLLTQFKDLVETTFNQDNLRLCGHNGKEFDFPYLCRRMLINDIKIPWALNTSGKKPWEVNHIDTMELWKFGDWKNFTSLDLLTSIFGIPYSKSNLDGSMVTKTYYEKKDGLKQIATYCQKDVIATAQLYLRLNNLPLIEENQIIISK